MSFLVANLEKFPHGGWISMLIASVLFIMMWIWQKARQIKSSYVEYSRITNYLDVFRELSNDSSIPKFATHLVYLTSGNKADEIESKAIYSIMQKQPKRADLYWFVHVDVVDYPNTMEYKVTTLMKDEAIRIDFRLGFRVEPRINLFFRKVVQDMVRNKEIDILSRYESLNRNNVIGDFKFVVIEKFLSNDNELPVLRKIILDIYFFIKEYSLSEEKAFGLDTSNVLVEKFPLVISQVRKVELKRVTE
jgi:KUP system potassium uptake protein